MERLKGLGMTRCAITDHGVMYGVVDFYSAMQGRGHQAGDRVRGVRLPGSWTDKSYVSREYSHLILLCENNTGYQNLMYLCSARAS